MIWYVRYDMIYDILCDMICSMWYVIWYIIWYVTWYIIYDLTYDYLFIWDAPGAPAKPGKKCGNKASITYEIRNRLPDKNGNPYPTLNQCYITCTKTANSNQEHTILILKKVILAELGMDASTETSLEKNRHTMGWVSGPLCRNCEEVLFVFALLSSRDYSWRSQDCCPASW